MNEDEQLGEQEDYMKGWIDEWGWTIGYTGRLHEWMNRWMRMNNVSDTPD